MWVEMIASCFVRERWRVVNDPVGSLRLGDDGAHLREISPYVRRRHDREAPRSGGARSGGSAAVGSPDSGMGDALIAVAVSIRGRFCETAVFRVAYGIV